MKILSKYTQKLEQKAGVFKTIEESKIIKEPLQILQTIPEEQEEDPFASL